MRKAAILLLILCVGCGPRRAAPVNPEQARVTLRTTLDAWKAGSTLDELPKLSPSITAQDFDWMAGSSLVDYQLVDDGKPEDANLRIQVKLTVRDAKGKSTQKTVTYIVGTDPVLTVFRAME